MTPAELWQQNRLRYLKALPTIIETELKDLELAKSTTMAKVEKIEKRRRDAHNRLREIRRTPGA